MFAVRSYFRHIECYIFTGYSVGAGDVAPLLAVCSVHVHHEGSGGWDRGGDAKDEGHQNTRGPHLVKVSVDALKFGGIHPSEALDHHDNIVDFD